MISKYYIFFIFFLLIFFYIIFGINWSKYKLLFFKNYILIYLKKKKYFLIYY